MRGGYKWGLPYAASKAFGANWSAGLSSFDGINSFSIHPDSFRTAMLDSAAAALQLPSADLFGGMNCCFDRLGDPANVGKLVVSLCDGTTKYKSGDSIFICDNITVDVAHVVRSIFVD